MSPTWLCQPSGCRFSTSRYAYTCRDLVIRFRHWDCVCRASAFILLDRRGARYVEAPSFSRATFVLAHTLVIVACSSEIRTSAP